MDEATFLGFLLSGEACHDAMSAYSDGRIDRTQLHETFEWADDALDVYGAQREADNDPQLWVL